MPIEIRELVIKAVVDNGDQDQEEGGSADPEEEGGEDQQSIIQACVEQVLQILNEKNER